MKIVDQSYQCNLSSHLSMEWFLDCHLQIFRSHHPLHTLINQNIVYVRNIILVTNMGFEMGWFIPNLMETLVNSVVREFNIDPQSLVWLEHYPAGDPQYHQELTSTGFSLVTFEWQSGQATNPRWANVNYRDLLNLLGSEDLKGILEYDLQTLVQLEECFN
ncbi:MAG: hypothetical protein ACO3EZ_13945 [Prochlorotrichaceae cyanobacterium]